MAPFWSGIALGLMIGAPILALAFVFRFFRAAGYFTLGFVRAARWDMAASRTPEAIAARAQQTQARRDASRASADRIRAWGVGRREKDLAWMSRHWATAWCARLNRRLLG